MCIRDSSRPATPQEFDALREAELARQQAAAQLDAENQVLRWLGELERSSPQTPDPLHAQALSLILI